MICLSTGAILKGRGMEEAETRKLKPWSSAYRVLTVGIMLTLGFLFLGKEWNGSVALMISRHVTFLDIRVPVL